MNSQPSDDSFVSVDFVEPLYVEIPSGIDLHSVSFPFSDIKRFSAFNIKGIAHLKLKLAYESLEFTSEHTFRQIHDFLSRHESEVAKNDFKFGLFNRFSKITKALRSTFSPEPEYRYEEAQISLNDVFTDMGTFQLVHDNPNYSRQSLDSSRWNELCRDGRVKNVKELKDIIYCGGIDAELRPTVWKYLLGYYSFDATDEELEITIAKKKEEYFFLRKQTPLVEHAHRISRDITRTDRDVEFYKPNSTNITSTVGNEKQADFEIESTQIDNGNLISIGNILEAYSVYDPEIGYVQGMSDLLSPVYFLMRDECDAFWCFVGMMKEMRDNFKENSVKIQNQLDALSTLVKKFDPNLDSLFSKPYSNQRLFRMQSHVLLLSFLAP